MYIVYEKLISVLSLHFHEDSVKLWSAELLNVLQSFTLIKIPPLDGSESYSLAKSYYNICYLILKAGGEFLFVFCSFQLKPFFLNFEGLKLHKTYIFLRCILAWTLHTRTYYWLDPQIHSVISQRSTVLEK